jgi:hypothetical protein
MPIPKQGYGSIWGSGPRDVFVVGEDAVLAHYDGERWSAGAVTREHLNAVWGTSASDMFAVGEHGTLLHYDGHAWNGVPSGTQKALYALLGTGSSDLFAVGQAGTIIHGNGGSFTAEPSGVTSDLIAMGAATDGLKAVAVDGTIVRRDAKSWTTLARAPTAPRLDLFRGAVIGGTAYGLHRVEDGVFALYHHDGRAWREDKTPFPPDAIWGVPNDVYIAAGGLFAHSADGRWIEEQSNRVAYTCAGFVGAGGIFALGGLGNLARRRGDGWTVMDPPTFSSSNYALSAMWATAEGELFVVGAHGLICTGPRVPIDRLGETRPRGFRT